MRFILTFTLLLAMATPLFAQATMASHIRRYEQDRRDFRRFYDLRFSAAHRERHLELHRDWMRFMDAIPFKKLTPSERIDWHLLKTEVEYQLVLEQRDAKKRASLAEWIPFAARLADLEAARRRLEPAPPAAAAKSLQGAIKEVEAATKNLDEKGEATPTWLLSEAARATRASKRVLDRFYRNLGPYDPNFHWRVKAAYDALGSKISDYREKLTKAADRDGPKALVGVPIGAEALAEDLAHEMLSYDPKGLIEAATKHEAWCYAEMKKAANLLGYGDDWRKALAEKVKTAHVAPGTQDELVARQAKEAIAFCDDKNLVTIPSLCRELWHLEMISAEGQKTLPFASYGNLRMNVAYPTAAMNESRKVDSMRGNNRHFSRLVTPHELIPGHHLQTYIARRSNTYRLQFRTPFYIEGWALYGEMLFWHHGFFRTPEEKIGALFWRLHRCARVIVSLRFHLGEMEPKAMVDYLCECVGLERDGATAEVRRYIGGVYSPLYQCGYLIGGLQLWRLREELVVPKGVSERAFHDAILKANSMPIEALRGLLRQQTWDQRRRPNWRFNH
ncbi:MAG: DUF885 family protein [Planctomycetota bacterium]